MLSGKEGDRVRVTGKCVSNKQCHVFLSKQRAGTGSRRDQARQLVTDLETRGSQALPLFISCLEDTGQQSLASLLRTSSQTARRDPEAIRAVDLRPVAVRPEELKGVKQDPVKPTPGRLTPVELGPQEVYPRVLRPGVPRPVDIGAGGFSDIREYRERWAWPLAQRGRLKFRI